MQLRHKGEGVSALPCKKAQTSLPFIMKSCFSIAVLLLLSLQILQAGPVSGQSVLDTRVTIPLENARVEDALVILQKVSRVRVGFAFSDVSNTGTVSVARKRMRIGDFLRIVLKGTGLEYRLRDSTILVYRPQQQDREPNPANVLYRWDAVQTVVNGYVTGNSDVPLVGAVVRAGSAKGTTNAEGRFSLSLPPGSYSLTISYVGYEKLEKDIQVQEKSVELGTFRLKELASTLNDVVIIGYGSTSKRNNTGSVSSIDSKTIAQQPVTDPLAALQGRIPGLMVNASNGLPGASLSVRVRGTNSLTTGANEPLYVIDGVPYMSTPMNQFTGGNGNQSPLASINPSDIERIDVLKDADATAIYGSRGANGVILVTTKKGKAGKTDIAVNMFSGFSKVTRLPDMLDTKQYLDLRRNAFANDGTAPTETNAPDLTLWDSTKSTDWSRQLIGHTARFTELQGSVSGGNQQTQFLLAGSYHHESTVMDAPYGYDRGSLHANINHTSLNRKFNINASIIYTADKNNILASDVSQYYNLAPNYPVHDSTGDYYWFGNIQNPMAYLGRKYVSRTNSLVGNTMIRYTVLPGLDLKTSLGYTKTNMDQTLTVPQYTLNPSNGAPSQANYGFSETHSYIIEPQATYSRRWGIGTLGALVGGTWQQRISEGHYLNGTGYPGDSQLDNMQAASSVVVRNYNYSQYRYNSVFGRLNYNIDNKYIVNGSFRRDGSSRFGPNKRFGNFWAIGGAWLFYEEPFLSKNLPFLSYGKLRASYGVTGNDQIGDYGYLDSWSTVSYPYGGTTGLTPARLANPNYSWETNKKLEVAMELGFLDNRILFTGSYYRNRSGNQLIGLTLSPQTGFDNITTNLPALVQNRGWEFELNTTNTKGVLTWTSTFNMSINRNSLLDYPGLEGSSVQYQYVIGQPLDVVLGYRFTGVDPQTGLPSFEDANKDEQLSELDDYVVLGKKSPTYFGGFGNSLSYKKWSLSFLFQFVKQDGPGLNYGYTSYPQGILSNTGMDALDRWRQAGDITSVPKATTTSGSAAYNLYSTYYRLSSATWGDASYIRLKNVSLAYSLSSIVKKWKWQDCSVYVQAQNLFTITGYKGFDPETQGAVMPPLKTFTAGLRFSL